MPKKRIYLLILSMLRFFAAVIPIVCAFGVSNLVYVFQYCGIFSFSIIIFFPTALQLQSIRVCKKRFHDIHVRMYMTQKNSSNSHDSGEPCDSSDDTGVARTQSSELVLHSLQLVLVQCGCSQYIHTHCTSFQGTCTHTRICSTYTFIYAYLTCMLLYMYPSSKTSQWPE